MRTYIFGAVGSFVGLWIILTFLLLHEISSNKMLIATYQQQIATLKADATAQAARDKSAAAVANSAVKESTKEADNVLSQTIPSGCEDVRTWAIKQSQGM